MKNISAFINSKPNKIILLLSILVSVVLVIGKTVNVYHFAAVGAVFEILWFPVLALVLILVITSVLYWRKDRFNSGSLNLYSLLLIIMAILFTVFYK